MGGVLFLGCQLSIGSSACIAGLSQSQVQVLGLIWEFAFSDVFLISK
jgi:hypothetical protein